MGVSEGASARDFRQRLALREELTAVRRHNADLTRRLNTP